MATPTTERPTPGALLEQRHQIDPMDGAFAALACEHPEGCSCPEDYPNWQPGGAA